MKEFWYARTFNLAHIFSHLIDSLTFQNVCIMSQIFNNQIISNPPPKKSPSHSSLSWESVSMRTWPWSMKNMRSPGTFSWIITSPSWKTSYWSLRRTALMKFSSLFWNIGKFLSIRLHITVSICWKRNKNPNIQNEKRASHKYNINIVTNAQSHVHQIYESEQDTKYYYIVVYSFLKISNCCFSLFFLSLKYAETNISSSQPGLYIPPPSCTSFNAEDTVFMMSFSSNHFPP